MHIVIDTNIWVSGLLWKGQAWELLKLAETGVITLYIAYPMLLELEEVLNYERFASRLRILGVTPSQLTAYALSLAVALDISRPPLPIVKADPDDDLFLVCAIQAKADYLVTNDRHLLTLKRYQTVSIIRLEDFLPKLGKQ
ncbi:MAG: putative toxin-antitoxin system toxin component, PIN family [Chloroflexi bacterium]|nr:putative toxin-antitoxin system toxin component, PIN family [Chloroflexota bacterium]